LDPAAFVMALDQQRMFTHDWGNVRGPAKETWESPKERERCTERILFKGRGGGDTVTTLSNFNNIVTTLL
jgi:hypothetical protein